MDARLLSTLALGLAVVLSALAVVYVEYEGRQLFARIERQRRAADALDVEWRTLQLERSTVLTNARLEGRARRVLHMRRPKTNEIILAEP